ncbi:MAG TPA: hypothetical protein VGB68_09685 [Pyrinomonadaceae bacterium]|jgi:hypothetical protein
MNDSILPVACTLNDAEFREREQVILRKLMQTAVERKELADGFDFRFSPDDDLLREITEMIILERKCCPFLDFKIALKAGNADIWLEITGAAGAKEFIATAFK